MRRHIQKHLALRAVSLLCALGLLPVEVLAKPLYISAYREIPVRIGPSADFKIMATLKIGEEVSLVEGRGDYYLVVIPDGSRGYIAKDSLTEQPPAETRLKALTQSTEQRVGELEAKTEQQERQLAALQEERSRLDAARKQAEATAARQTQRARELQAQQQVVDRDLQIRWFLAGGGVFLGGGICGWLWGAMVKRNRQSRLHLSRL